MTLKTLGIMASTLVVLGLVGCSSEPEPEKLPTEATQGGNVVKDDALKKQLQGDSGGGGGAGSQPTPGQDAGSPVGN